jgi:hypothetical protein
LWNPNGRKLFYFIGDTPEKARMMALDFSPAATPRIGAPRLLFEFDGRDLKLECEPGRCFDVASDGQRFYVAIAALAPSASGDSRQSHIQLVRRSQREGARKVASKPLARLLTPQPHRRTVPSAGR